MKDPKRHSASASRSLLRFDWAAKTVLREKENHDILEGLLGVLFGEEVRIVELLESESNAVGGNDKFNRVDPSKLFPEHYLLRVNAYSGEPHSHLEEWMRYLKDGIVDEGTEAPGLKEAYARLQYCALPEKARKAYDAYLYDMHYQQDVIAAYDQAGWERGRE